MAVGVDRRRNSGVDPFAHGSDVAHFFVEGPQRFLDLGVLHEASGCRFAHAAIKFVSLAAQRIERGFVVTEALCIGIGLVNT